MTENKKERRAAAERACAVPVSDPVICHPDLPYLSWPGTEAASSTYIINTDSTNQ